MFFPHMREGFAPELLEHGAVWNKLVIINIACYMFYSIRNEFDVRMSRQGSG